MDAFQSPESPVWIGVPCFKQPGADRLLSRALLEHRQLLADLVLRNAMLGIEAHEPLQFELHRLLGHLTRMMMESGTGAEVDFDALPLLPDVASYAEQGIYSGANERNSAFVAGEVEFAARLGVAQQAILYDAQTSGGLLMAVPPARVAALLDDLHAAGVAAAARIGRVTDKGRVRIVVR